MIFHRKFDGLHGGVLRPARLAKTCFTKDSQRLGPASCPVSGMLAWTLESSEMLEQSEDPNRPWPAAARDLASKKFDAPTAKPHMFPTPAEIVAHLDRHVIGHDLAKRTLSVACYNHFIEVATADLAGGSGRVHSDNHTIIVGPSGCGKSAMIEALGFLGIPILQIDCSNLSPHGYKGRGLSQSFDFIAGRLSDEDSTRPAIVVWEEIDKLCGYGGSAGGDLVIDQYRAMVQAEALRFLDGAACGSEGNLDASRILSIGCGAFSGMDEIRNPEQKPAIGFGKIGGNRLVSECLAPLPPLLPEHLVQYGLLPEFVGRFSRVTALAPLDAVGMRKVLVDSDSSILKRRIAFFGLHAVTLVFSEDGIDEMVSMAMAHPTGVRGLRLVLDRVLGKVEFRLPELVAQGVIGIAMNRRAVRGEVPPVEMRADDGKAPESLLAVRRRAGCYRGKIIPTQKDELSI